MKSFISIAALLHLMLWTTSSQSSDKSYIEEYKGPLSPSAFILSNSEETFHTEPTILSKSIHSLILEKKKDLYYREFETLQEAEQYNKVLRQKEKIISAEDGRAKLLEKVHEEPWNCNFYLEIYYENINKSGKSRTYYGSGILINDNILLTAGHNLYDEADGGYPTRIDCFGSCYGNIVLAETSVFPTQNPHSVFVSSQFVSSAGKDTTSDIGLVLFENEAAQIMRDKINNFARPMDYLKIAEKLKDAEFCVAGYPGERIAYMMNGKVTLGQKPNLIQYNIDTEPGQSGSGVFFIQKGKAHCIGVHAYAGEAGEDFNIGVLINDELKTKIRNYISAEEAKK